jgi:membrane associated rhomboid family serine protease
VIPLPISDENPTLRRPVVTVALIAVNVIFFLFEKIQDPTLLYSTLHYGAIPAFLIHGVSGGVIVDSQVGRQLVQQDVPWPMTIFTSMFMHGGWLHLLGNMWFLWIFGDNIEDAMGRVKYLLFYLLCGLIAALAQVFAQLDTVEPMVGASGAIAGVLGAYLMLYPRARVRCLWIIIILITTIYVPAWLILSIWFFSQFLMYLQPGSHVAWMAHVGGFIAGFLLVRLFVSRPPPRREHWPPLYSRA